MDSNSPKSDSPKTESTAVLSALSYSLDKWLLNRLYSSIGRPQIILELQNRAMILPERSSYLATITISDRRTLLKMLLDPQLGFGEAYTSGRVQVDGNLVDALENVFRSMNGNELRNIYARIVSPFLSFVQKNSSQGARSNVHRHYDLDSKFFRLWLDSNLVYSGAYFSSPSLTLEQAQIEKMEYICRKLNLHPGERVIDIGCGWGALAFHMAQHYGVCVRAYSNSHEQILWARNRAAELRLSHRIDFIEDDYRNIQTKADAVVSVGMLEHVGADNYFEMGRVLNRILVDTGRGLIQTIGRNQALPFNLWTRKHIFPGTYAPTLRQMMDMFEPYDFSIVDVENLRAHYAMTLQHWLDRFEHFTDLISEQFGQEFVRAWRLYLSGSIAGFRSGSLQLFQVVFARKDCPLIPFTRERLYLSEQREVAETSADEWVEIH